MLEVKESAIQHWSLATFLSWVNYFQVEQTASA